MLSRTEGCGNSAYDWNTIDNWRCEGSRLVTLRPLIKTRPASGSSSPAIMRNRVDSPQPDGPSKAVNQPLRICRLIPLITLWSPHDLRTLSSSMATSASAADVQPVTGAVSARDSCQVD